MEGNRQRSCTKVIRIANWARCAAEDGLEKLYLDSVLQWSWCFSGHSDKCATVTLTHTPVTLTLAHKVKKILQACTYCEACVTVPHLLTTVYSQDGERETEGSMQPSRPPEQFKLLTRTISSYTVFSQWPQHGNRAAFLTTLPRQKSGISFHVRFFNSTEAPWQRWDMKGPALFWTWLGLKYGDGCAK